ncbi:TPA: hypothetical protein ACOEP6_004659 [Enterobacter ludwigii]
MKILFVILFFTISTPAFCDNNVIGYWSVKCGGFGGYIQVISENDVRINVNDNNLYVKGVLTERSDGRSEVYYREVLESMNDDISWEAVSKIKPIAELSYKNNVLSVVWKGFYDVNKKKYLWVNEPDFVIANNEKNIEMKQCHF